MSKDVELGTITTDVPARMDRLPWARFHWMVVVGLGSVWILDGLEVTMVGNVAARMTEDGSGISMTAGQIGTAGAIYVLGACVGAIKVNEAKESKTAEVAAGAQRKRDRLRPGPGFGGVYSPWPSVSSREMPEEVGAKEVQGIIDFVKDMQPVSESELHRAIGARRWVSGSFHSSVREAIRQGHIRRDRYGKLETTDR